MPAHVGPPVDTVTATVAEADLVESAVDVAVIVAVSAPVFAGVKVTPVPDATPAVELKVPSAAGLTAKFTVFANAPVPVTVGVQVAVCVIEIDVGAHTSATPVIVAGALVTVIFADPEMFVYPSAAELAVQVSDPVPDGVNIPPDVIVPPVAVHVTAEL
jgi:hypothetical protein